MIEELYVQNIGGIEEARISFSPGFVAITGESGSGKSSLVRALELISGKRASKDLIKSGHEEATVKGIFDTETQDDNICKDESLFLERTISKTRKGKSMVQEQQIPLNSLAKTAENLLAIQSQFAQLDLLDSEKQMDILDTFGGDDILNLREFLKNQVTCTIDRERELLNIKKRQKTILQRFQGAEEILTRWEKLGIIEDPEQEWEAEYERLTSELTRLKEIKRNISILSGDENEGVKDILETALKDLLDNISSEKREELQQEVDVLLESYQNILEQVEEESEDSRRDELEEAIEALESKMGTLRRLKRSAGVPSIAELIDYCREAQAEMKWLSDSNIRKAEIEREVEDSRKRASRMALDLRKLRNNAAKSLEEKVNLCLAELAMPNSGFAVAVIPQTKIRQTGADLIEFRLSWGSEKTGPVAKMASGGELSRILLAIRLSLPIKTMPDSIVFDEVEAGLGGKAAVMAGTKLRELSKIRQVILITHEASIAALADQHLLAQKDEKSTYFQQLNGENRISELARMLSGDYGLDEARSHASRLLEIKSYEV